MTRTIALCETIGFILHVRHQRQVFPLSFWQCRRKGRGELVVEEDALVFREQELLTNRCITSLAEKGKDEWTIPHSTLGFDVSL